MGQLGAAFLIAKAGLAAGSQGLGERFRAIHVGATARSATIMIELVEQVIATLGAHEAELRLQPPASLAAIC